MLVENDYSKKSKVHYKPCYNNSEMYKDNKPKQHSHEDQYPLVLMHYAPSIVELVRQVLRPVGGPEPDAARGLPFV